MNAQRWMLVLMTVVGAIAACGSVRADLAIQGFDSAGQLTFSTLNNGTNYNYQVEWAPSPAGPWSPFTGVGAWLNNNAAVAGSSVTNIVPMCYRVVATLGDYMVVDISGGANAVNYPVSYYRTLASLPGGVGVNRDAYKTTNMVFRRIPSGTFTMGSPADELGRNSGEVQHQVTLTQPFYMSVFEVTQKQWEMVMGTWPSHFTNTSCRDSRPVELVSYDMIRGAGVGAGWPTNSHVDVDSFMGRLLARTGKAFDLPTESQWEYAGRAGTTTALNSGENLTATDSCTNMSEVGRYWYNGGTGYTQDVDTTGGTAKVGSYFPNAWGLYDIHGNVWEWCLDWSGTYPGSVRDPVGAISGSDRVLHGGGWSGGASDSRVGSRINSSPGIADHHSGFRAVLLSGQ